MSLGFVCITLMHLFSFNRNTRGLFIFSTIDGCSGSLQTLVCHTVLGFIVDCLCLGLHGKN
jgi:hypothetical protein